MADLERLFLLEILVDTVQFTSPQAQNLQESCVQFQFLNFPPLTICEEDFAQNPEGYHASEVPFNSGKSCLFALPSNFAARNLNLYINVFRSNSNEQRQLCGTAVINMGRSFTNLFQASASQSVSEPISSTSRNIYTFFDPHGNSTGKAGIFIRLSCFGKLIVTQFEVKNPEEQEYVFRNNECMI